MSLIATLLLHTAGCQTVEKYSLTHKLWAGDQFRSFAEPATPANLKVFHDLTASDWLVQYDESSESRDFVRRRSYYLRENATPIAERTKPRFVQPSGNQAGTPVPVLAPLAPAPSNATVVVRHPVKPGDNTSFAIYEGPQMTGQYELPVYAEHSGTATKIALTPFAATGDVIMVGLVCSVVAFIVWTRTLVIAGGNGTSIVASAR